MHGYSEMQQVAKVEGEITDERDLDLKETLFLLDEAVVTLDVGERENRRVSRSLVRGRRRRWLGNRPTCRS